jgi:hypothetical protein
MHFRPKKNSPIGVSGKGKKATKPDYLKIILNHGDLLVMHGTDIHKYYEVSAPRDVKNDIFLLLIRIIACGQP